MIIEVDKTDEFLEHFGVKGQRWGVRKQKSTSDSRPKSHTKRNVAIATGVVGVGAVAAMIVLRRHNAKKVASIARSQQNIREMGKAFSDGLVKQHGTAHLNFNDGSRSTVTLKEFRNGDYVKLTKKFPAFEMPPGPSKFAMPPIGGRSG